MRRTLRVGFIGLVAGSVLLSAGIRSVAATTGLTSGETITVSNTSTTAVKTSTVFAADHRYRLAVSGTVSDWCTTSSCQSGDANKTAQPNVGVDGVWCYAKWRCPTPEAWQQLSVNGKGILDFAGLTPADEPYSSSHEYSVEFTGVSGVLSLGAADALAGSTSDNSGAFKVTFTDLGPAQFGIGFVPFLNSGDETEQAMHSLVGAFEDVNRIYNPATPEQLFKDLIKQQQLGRKITTLVIAGHGSMANPRIDLSGSDLEPKDVDLPYLHKLIDVLTRAQARGALTSSQRQQLASAKSQVAFLESVGDAMAPGAQVLLVNCSTAATPDGQRFVRNLGNVLVGKNGGVIVASRSDVELGQVRSLANKIRALWKTGQVVTIGGFFVSGDWVKIPISARGR